MFDSDFNIRLATLAALGGDTSVTFDSVYSIDLEILKLTSGGGGGGMDYNAIKAALAASGVTEILFNDGDSSVTLDYAKVMQIGQGGDSNYFIVNTLDELSGVTAQDGMLAYLKDYDVIEERMVLRMDFYGGWNYLRIAYNDGNTLTLETWDNGHATSFGGNAKYYKYGDGNSDTMNDHQSDLPQDFKYNANGAIGTYVSMEEGDEYSTNGDYKNTFYFKKYDGAYPTITWEPAGDCTTVSSSLTTENVTVHYEKKGWYIYNATASKWLAYDVYYSELTPNEINDIFDDYGLYHIPFYFRKQFDNNGKKMEYRLHLSYYNIDNLDDIGALMTSDIQMNNSDNRQLYSMRFWHNSQGEWLNDVIKEDTIPSTTLVDSDIRNTVKRNIQTTSDGGIVLFGIGGLYNVSVSGTVSGVIASTTVNIDVSSSSSHGAYYYRNRMSGSYDYPQLCDNGIFISNIAFAPSISPDWTVVDYYYYWDDNVNDYKISLIAVRLIDNQDDTATLEVFYSGQIEDGYNTNNIEFQPNQDDYTWSLVDSQSVSFKPTLYGVKPFNGISHRNYPSLYKIIELV